MRISIYPSAYRVAASVVVCVLMMAMFHAVAEEVPAEDNPAAEKVELPGITIDAKNKRIDVDATVCLDEGLLEVVACTADSREHESIVLVKASPTHIHAALLLIGATNGHPAMTKPTNPEKTEFVHLPPRGDAVAVSLMIPDKEGKLTERPISDFVKPYDHEGPASPDEAAEDEDGPDPAEVFETFVFAGSHVIENGKGEKFYLAEQSGNVISISTFGDEVLCLPSFYSTDNAHLSWQVNNKHLPKVGTKVKLRLTLLEPAEEEQEAPGDTE